MRLVSVSELTGYIKDKLDNDYALTNIWVKGELSNYKHHSSGHLYFTLKDAGACIKGVMFRSRSSRLQFRPENGMSVLVRGYVSVFERDGCYQLYAEEMEPEGLGALYLAFEQMKEKLEREGLFDPACKKPLPRIPRTVGLVTSPTGAAIRDMLHILQRRWPGLKIIIVPVAVQGHGAPTEIARGIELLNQYGAVDVIIVGRGGGSLEELWAFNTEPVARSIFASRLPVVSAVGHETDYTIADMAADLRAPTPSAAAELVVPDRQELKRYLQDQQQRLEHLIKSQLARERKRLDHCLDSPTMRHPLVITGNRQQLLDMLVRRLDAAGKLALADRAKNLAALAGRLEGLSPLNTLARGYSICTRLAGGGGLVQKAADVAVGERVLVKLHQGALRCQVEAKE